MLMASIRQNNIQPVKLNPAPIDEQAKEEDVSALLASDQALYTELAQADELLLKISEMKAQPPLLHPVDTPEFKTYADKVALIKQSLLKRQEKLKSVLPEQAQQDPTYFSLDTITGFPNQVKQYVVDFFNAGLNFLGLGIAPIIALSIKAVVAITAAIASVIIIDDLTDSNEERAELMDATRQFATDMGMTPEEAMQLIEKTAPKETGNGNFLKTLLWPIGLFTALMVGTSIWQKTRRQ